MKAVVTGGAGFIGSTLCDALLKQGDSVIAIDSFTPYYDIAFKRSNIQAALTSARFELVEADLRTADLRPIVEGADVLYHQAAQPGVRLSWGSFDEYVADNILATQRLLDASVAMATPRVVYASSSSVYGRQATYPCREGDLPRPNSPYGVTKMAAEHLCHLYAANHRLSTLSLRYFTVYGPRQRPDMAAHRLLEAAMSGSSFPLYGDGTAVRDFTYVSDIVRANIAAAQADAAPGTVVNVAGGTETSMADLIELTAEVVGKVVLLDRLPAQRGDVERTGGAIDLARNLLNWEPMVPLREGLSAQAEWHRLRTAEAPV